MQDLLNQLRQKIKQSENPAETLNLIRAALHDVSPCSAGPVDFVRWVPIEKVEPNDYNPNSVAKVEMGLLLKSVEQDGYTQPIVTIHDKTRDIYVIVDGFHRYFVMKLNKGLQERYHSLLPITVIDKDINDRMASTVRHNRARGKHSVNGMSSMVFKMLDGGMTDESVCNELGMEPEELLRLKHITGFSKLFADATYRKSWLTRNQIDVKLAYEQSLSSPTKEA